MFTFSNVQYKDILKIEKLTFQDKQIICLFGESGSGKSTLLKMLNGMLTQDSGKIFYKERLIDDYDPVELRKKVVMLGQDPVMFQGTVRENLLFGLKFTGKSEADDSKLKELLKDLRLEKNLEDDADQLSGGEKQRVAFGRVLLMEAAEVYLLDEPTSALDEETETKVMSVFTQHIKREGKSAIFVTHSKEVAEKYADQIIYMNEVLANEEISE
ncbi:ABC transporter ATP-binding protein [Gracilibacillus oryzae]|uniref:ABC transporter ATP-binding protein n=1 Tax=Gracilibacillus oryzae TaxID=1672701 RepID=A0A7C8GTM3_9BACI|nr:ABC transporter ATP-binding protein [Gracilibacillus oryzae]KAB8134723.1 ABC transporter ATP-binding protein [Gracilibacillus oryzae]